MTFKIPCVATGCTPSQWDWSDWVRSGRIGFGNVCKRAVYLKTILKAEHSWYPKLLYTRTLKLKWVARATCPSRSATRRPERGDVPFRMTALFYLRTSSIPRGKSPCGTGEWPVPPIFGGGDQPFRCQRTAPTIPQRPGDASFPEPFLPGLFHSIVTAGLLDGRMPFQRRAGISNHVWTWKKS
jgi:hypothetical protein